MPDLTAGNNLIVTDRLAIVLTGGGISKLLGVPKMCNGTGRAQADTVYSALLDWNVVDQVKGMCFDTTASNTGVRNVACNYIESILKKTDPSFCMSPSRT